MSAAEKSAREGRLGDEAALAGLPGGGGVAGSVASNGKNSGGEANAAGGDRSLAGGDVAAVGGGGGGSSGDGAATDATRMRWS